MRLEIIDAGLGIAAVNNINDFEEYTEKIKKVYGKEVDFSKITVLYLQERDWIVINKGHPLHRVYLDIIQAYLELSEDSRNLAIINAPTGIIKDLLFLLNEIINKRQQRA